MSEIVDRLIELRDEGYKLLITPEGNKAEAYLDYITDLGLFYLERRETAVAAVEDQREHIEAFTHYLKTDPKLALAAERWPDFSTKQRLDTLRNIAEIFQRIFEINLPVKIEYDPLLNEKTRGEKRIAPRDRIEIKVNPHYHRGPKRESFRESLFLLTHELGHGLEQFYLSPPEGTDITQDQFGMACMGFMQPRFHEITQLMLREFITFRPEIAEVISQQFAVGLYMLDTQEFHSNLFAKRCTADLPPIFDQSCNTRFLPANPENNSPKPQPALTM